MTRGRQPRNPRPKPEGHGQMVGDGEERAAPDDDYEVSKSLKSLTEEESLKHQERVRRRSLTVYDWMREKNRIHAANKVAIRERRFEDIQKIPPKPFG